MANDTEMSWSRYVILDLQHRPGLKLLDSVVFSYLSCRLFSITFFNSFDDVLWFINYQKNERKTAIITFQTSKGCPHLLHQSWSHCWCRMLSRNMTLVVYSTNTSDVMWWSDIIVFECQLPQLQIKMQLENAWKVLRRCRNPAISHPTKKCVCGDITDGSLSIILGAKTANFFFKLSKTIFSFSVIYERIFFSCESDKISKLKISLWPLWYFMDWIINPENNQRLNQL